MSVWIKPPKNYTTIKDMKLSRDDIHGMLGDFRIKRLLSDDYLILISDYKDSSQPINGLATQLLNTPVYGDAILLERHHVAEGWIWAS